VKVAERIGLESRERFGMEALRLVELSSAAHGRDRRLRARRLNGITASVSARCREGQSQ
jgi:hypothetical protein